MPPDALYHGGAPGFAVGGVLLPPSVTGVKTTFDWFEDARRRGMLAGPGVAMLDASQVYRRDRVYATAILEEALSWAQHWIPPDARWGDRRALLEARGAIYRVEADAGCVLEADPDTIVPGAWWACERFVVAEVVEAEVRPLSREEHDRQWRAELDRQGLVATSVPRYRGPLMAVPKSKRRK